MNDFFFGLLRRPWGRGCRIVVPISGRALLAVAAVGLIAQPGCVRQANLDAGLSSVSVSRPVLSVGEAAELAARLANERCERQYRRRPFRAEQHAIVLRAGLYRWGGLDVGAPGGLSAFVTFRQDGSEPRVEVYYSADAVRPPEAR